MSPRVPVLAALLAAALLVACGGDDGGATTNATDGAAAPGATTTAPSGAQAQGAAARGVKLVKVGSFDQPLYVTAPPADKRRVFVVGQGGRIDVVRGGR